MAKRKMPERKQVVSLEENNQGSEDESINVKMVEISKYQEVVGCHRLNLRSRPDQTSERLATIDNGTYLKVLESDGDWTYVENEAGFKGYVLSKYLGDFRDE